MTLIGDHNAAASSQLPATRSGHSAAGSAGCRVGPPWSPRGVAGAKSNGTAELREQFTQFVGEAFFGQMIKAMRATTGKPAYFHGGRAEEVFQGQLDQKLAEHLTEASADHFAEPMFERQFPRLAMRDEQTDLNQLAHLRRH